MPTMTLTRFALAFFFVVPFRTTTAAAAAAATATNDCALYLSDEDSLYMGHAGVKAGERIGQGVLLHAIAMQIANYNRDNIPWLPYAWKTEYVKSLGNEDEYFNDYYNDETMDAILLSGPGMYIQCASARPDKRHPNVELQRNKDGKNNDGTTPSFYLQALEDIQPGQEILLNCPTTTGINESPFDKDVRKTVRSLDSATQLDLDEVIAANEVICIDQTLPKTATATSVKKNQTLLVTPLLHLHRLDVAILEQWKPKNSAQEESSLLIPLRDHGIVYNQTNIIANQTILQGCLADPGSNLILWPTVAHDWTSMVQHSSTKANVAWRWSNALYGDTSDIRNDTPLVQLLETSETTLVVELYALHDLKAGTQLYMNYGQEYQQQEQHHAHANQHPHPVVVPNLFSDNWMRQDVNPYGDFIAHKLPPNVISPVRWANTALVASPWGFRIGLHPRITQTLVEYAKRLGIVDMMRYATVQGNPLAPGTNLFVNNGLWYLQRPEARRRSNLHWLSPAIEAGHIDALQTLSHAGFDEVLQAIGEYFNMDGLAVYQVTFMATSWTAKGWLHWDMINTQGKTFNIIIPLLFANETGPELDIQDSETEEVGRYRYEPNVAIMQGDDAVHATSAVDYMNEFRLALSIYVSDINEDNLDETADALTNLYPPKRDMDLFRSWAGIHWDPNDPTKKLPKPPPDHVLLRSMSAADEKEL